MAHLPIPDHVEDLARRVVDAAYRVHSELGPGLLESVYQSCLSHLLRKDGLAVEEQKPIPVRFDGLRFDGAFRLDLLVGGELIVEVKSVERVLPVHKAQLLTYLRLTGLRLGLLINFNEALLRDGLRRVVN